VDYSVFYQDLRACEAEVLPNWSFCWGQACNRQANYIKKRRNQCMMARGWQLSRSKEAFRP